MHHALMVSFPAAEIFRLVLSSLERSVHVHAACRMPRAASILNHWGKLTSECLFYTMRAELGFYDTRMNAIVICQQRPVLQLIDESSFDSQLFHWAKRPFPQYRKGQGKQVKGR